jgi:thiol:disulfide interchange protein DsbC
MKKSITASFLAAVLMLAVVSVGIAETVEETFKKTFPKISFDSISPTDIKGIYEVVVGMDIGYFAPEQGYLIIGDIRDKDMVSITGKRKQALMAEAAKKLPLDKAVKIGNGKSTVIEITDPDCPYCRRGYEFLSKKSDITKYVFFMPLPMHPDAENKSKYILCSEDKAKAYGEAMSGKLDDKKYTVCKKQEVDDLIKIHKEAAQKLGVSGTPFFIVNGKVVQGAAEAQIDEALKQK